MEKQKSLEDQIGEILETWGMTSDPWPNWKKESQGFIIQAIKSKAKDAGWGKPTTTGFAPLSDEDFL
jgi:hypothetical protein